MPLTWTIEYTATARTQLRKLDKQMARRIVDIAREPGARPSRLGRSIEKDYKWNIDAQDAQDNQDGRLLHETLTRAMIACGFEDVREHKPAVSGKNPVHPVHRCESNSNLPMLDYEPVSSQQAQA